MRLAEHFIFFRNKFYKFNNTGTGMLDSIYHMVFKLLNKSHNATFGVKMQHFAIF